MLDVTQFKQFVVDPALKAIDLWTPEAADLVLGTAIQESRLTYLTQLGKGPAKGLFQMERGTHDDIWNNYLRFNRPLKQRLEDLSLDGTADEMVWNLQYAAAMCRVHYKRKPGLIPKDLESQAAYWKQHYNTSLGAGTVEQYLENWHHAHHENP